MAYRRVISFIILLLLCSVGLANPVDTATAQTAPCYTAAMEALTRRGAIYSQGGALANDPINPATGDHWPRKGPNSFDCSGLVWWAYAQAGVTVGESTYSQINNGVEIPCRLDDLDGGNTTCWTLGDLIFLRSSYGQHVALYVGDGLFMDCYNHSTGCILHDVTTDSYYHSAFWQARRITSGCEQYTNDPGNPDDVILTSPAAGDTAFEYQIPPQFDLIPDLVGYVAFHVTQCNECTPDGAFTIERKPPPETHWYDIGSVIRWLGWSIEDTILDLICWLLILLQLLANIATEAVNIFLLVINTLWKLAIYCWLTIRTWLYAFWFGFETVRSQIHQLGYLIEFAKAWGIALLDLFLLALQTAAQLIMVLGQIVLMLLNLLGWIGGLAIQLIISIFAALQGTQTPAPLADTEYTTQYRLVRGGLEGLHDSQLGWLFYLSYGLAYVGFVTWLARFLSASKDH